MYLMYLFTLLIRECTCLDPESILLLMQPVLIDLRKTSLGWQHISVSQLLRRPSLDDHLSSGVQDQLG
jgi:hypothetical protein